MLRPALLVGAIAVGVYYVSCYLLNERRHHQQARQWGCQLPYRETGTWWGISIIRDFMRAMREERAAPYYIEWQESNPRTAVTSFLDADLFSTYEPANIQALLATQFEDFSLGYRLKTWAPMIGKGIFTTDGAEWLVPTHSGRSI
jgi:hypothetical protein